MSYIDTLRETLLARPSGAISRIAQAMLQKKATDSLTVLRGVDNKNDDLSTVEEDQKSPVLKVQDKRDGQGTLVTIGESETPTGTTLSRIQITEQQRLDREANNSTRTTTANYAASNLSGPVVAAAKYLMPVIRSPIMPLSSTVYSLMTMPKITQADIPAITSSGKEKNKSTIESFITNSYNTLKNFMAKKEDPAISVPTTKVATSSSSSSPENFGSFFSNEVIQEQTKAEKPQSSFIAESTNREFRVINREQQRLRQEADKKTWELNQQMVKAIETAKEKTQETNLSSTAKVKKKDSGNKRIDSYLRSLAAMAGIDLSTHKGITSQTLSSMLLRRGTNPFLMMSIFEKMGKNFLSTYSILEKSGNQHLFGSAIARGLDVSSTAAADQYALQFGDNKSFMA